MGSGKKRKRTTPAKARPAGGTPQTPGRRWIFSAYGCLLLVSGIIAYWPSFQVPFQFDDITNIVDNPYLRISSLSPASLASAAFQDFKQNRPLSNLTFALNYYVNLVDPYGYHVVNFLFHAISGFCLWGLLRINLVRQWKDAKAAEWASALVALLWLVHPLNTQAVTYIVQRQAVMAGSLSLLCLLCYDLARSTKRKWLYLLSGLSGMGAVFSKESALVLPLIIFLYDLWFFQELKPGWTNRNWKWIMGICGFYVLFSLFVLRGAMVGKMSADYSREVLSRQERVLTQPRVLLEYLSLIFFPAGSRLSLEHDPQVSTSLFKPWSTLPSIAVILLLAGFAMAKARKYPLLSFSVIWYLGWLSVESLPLPIDLMTEHRLYIASIPALALIAALCLRVSANFKAGVVALLVMSMLLGISTYTRNRVWLTRAGLWRDAALKSPGKARSWNNYCSYLMEADMMEQGGRACKTSVQLDPRHIKSWNNLGTFYFKKGDLASAEKMYSRAVEIDPYYGHGYFNLGLVKASQGDAAQAKQFFQKVMGLEIKDANLYYKLGMGYETVEDRESASQAFARALAIQSELAPARLKVAAYLAGQNRCREALDLLGRAPAQDPSFAGIYDYCRSH